MRGLIDNSVNIGGDQVITGVKKISNDSNPQAKIICENLDVNNLPASDIWAGLQFDDVNGVRIGKIEPSIRPNGTIQINLSGSNLINDVIKYCSLSACVGADGKTWVESPASDKNNSVVTTVAKSKELSGYYKLGNKLIVQWGWVGSFGTDTVVTLPTPFASENAWAGSITALSATAYGYPTYFKVRTATNFTGRRNDNNKPSALWVAIGYGA